MGDIRLEWDRIAKLRQDQIGDGRDLSYSHVLEPTILDLVAGCDHTSVLDVGCGVGILTARLAERSENVTGIDISGESIALAKGKLSSKGNLRFLATSIEAFATEFQERFTVIVANMVLMTILDLPPAVDAVARLLKPGGCFVFTITHPCFWPVYWKYDQADWFEYSKEIPIEAPFRISAESPSEFITTHVHRPLECYFSALARSNLSVTSVIEPRPRGNVPAEYLQNWRFPRFLAMVCSGDGSGIRLV